MARRAACQDVGPIRFELHRFEDSAHELVPIIGSTSLVDLVKQFEEVRGSTLPAGSPALSWTITALETSAFT